jgi:hypothetical protein
MIDVVSSTPKLKKKLFGAGDPDESDESFLDNINESDRNGNHTVLTNGILGEHEEDEYKEIYEDLLSDKVQMAVEKGEPMYTFQGYRNPTPIMQTPIRGAKNDSNSNHINHNFNNSDRKTSSNDSMFCNDKSSGSTALISYLDESGSV